MIQLNHGLIVAWRWIRDRCCCVQYDTILLICGVAEVDRLLFGVMGDRLSVWFSFVLVLLFYWACGGGYFLFVFVFFWIVVVVFVCVVLAGFVVVW